MFQYTLMMAKVWCSWTGLCIVRTMANSMSYRSKGRQFKIHTLGFFLILQKSENNLHESQDRLRLQRFLMWAVVSLDESCQDNRKLPHEKTRLVLGPNSIWLNPQMDTGKLSLTLSPYHFFS